MRKSSACLGKNGNVTCDCKHNMGQSACTHKVRENKQGDCTATGAHDPSCFKKNVGRNEGQKLDILDATEPMKVTTDEVALADLSWTPEKVNEHVKIILTLKTNVTHGSLTVK